MSLLVVEGALYVDQSKDITIDSYYIFIMGGLFQMGTHEEPYEKQAVLTMHGDRYTTVEIPYIGAKVLAVASKGVPSSQTNTGTFLILWDLVDTPIYSD